MQNLDQVCKILTNTNPQDIISTQLKARIFLYSSNFTLKVKKWEVVPKFQETVEEDEDIVSVSSSRYLFIYWEDRSCQARQLYSTHWLRGGLRKK